MRSHRACATLVVSLLIAAGPVAAQEPSASKDPSLTLRTSLKASVLISRAPDDPTLSPQPSSATSFWRLRLEPAAHFGDTVTVEAAYEQRLRVFSASLGPVGSDVLPPETPAPYRIRQLDWQLSSSSGSSWRHEIDRLSVTVHAPRAELTMGRQALGWGRGVMFGAIDLFSPFTPLEADREWRRGVDAIRADIKLADRVSLDTAGAFGETVDSSIVAARLRGYAGKADIELAGGRRARDLFAGVSSSGAMGDAEIHGELAVFRAPEPLAAGGLDNGRVALKAVAGGSYRFALGKGLLLHVEYHYSGFGAKTPGDILSLLAISDFRERYLRGDTQILQRHALAVLASYESSPEFALAMQWLQSPVDGSGLVAPSATLTLGDKLSVLVSAYIPYGRAPRGSLLRSEYGAAPRSGLVQVRIYG